MIRSGRTGLAGPGDYDALSALILRRQGDLPKRLAHVARFALEHPHDIAFGTAASVAARAQVQPSTLVRLAQALGYTGFSQLQAVFRGRLRVRGSDYDERLRALKADSGRGPGPAALLAAFSQAAAGSLADLIEHTEPTRLVSAVAALGGARIIYIAGQRRSFPVAAYVSYLFAQLGISQMLLASPSGVDLELLSQAKAGDALLAFSFAPYAPGTVALVERARDQKLPLVAVTDGPFSPLAASTADWLEVKEAEVDGFRNPAPIFALALTLAVSIAERRRPADE